MKHTGNTMGRVEFIAESLFWMLVGLFWFHHLCFLPLPGMTSVVSGWILWAVIIVGTALGMACAYRRWRSYLSVAAQTALPLGVYCAVACRRYVPALATATLAAGCVLGAALWLLILTPRIRQGGDRKRILARRAERAAVYSIRAAALCLSVLLLVTGGRQMLGMGVIHARMDAEPPAARQASEETLEQLREERWQALTLQERMDVLGAVCAAESARLGVNAPLVLQASALEEDTLGRYRPDRQEITVALDLVENGSGLDCVTTLLHEVYHSYEWMLVELYLAAPEEYRNMWVFRHVESYMREFRTEPESYEDYVVRACETHAREYAELRTLEYEAMLEESGSAEGDGSGEGGL